MLFKVENLNKSYKNNHVLKDLSFEIDNDKDLVALIGLNGSGKSTLLEIICGVKKKDSGRIVFQDKEITEKSQVYQFKRQLGYMPQNFSLFNDLTVKENLEYLYSVYELNNFSVIQETIDKCFLSGKEQITAKNLSGGYRQLLSLAGSIMHNPRLLILDEPTSAMDPLFRSQFWNIIYSYNERGTAVLVTTHYMEEILNCKRFLCLASGRIIHKNDVENIFENGKFRSVDEMLKFYIFKETV